MNYVINISPVSNRVIKSLENEAHAVIVKSPHLEEPTDPVEDQHLRGGASSECSHHHVLGDEDWRDSEETQVVTGIYAVPEGTYTHRYGNPRTYICIYTHIYKHVKHLINIQYE